MGYDFDGNDQIGEIREKEAKGAEGGFGGGERAKEEGTGDRARWTTSPNYLESPGACYLL